MLIMEENQGYSATQGNCGSANAYFCALAAEYASVADWYGVTHPSLPNYLAITSGSTQGCGSDSCGSYASANLGQQLTQAGIPWAAYMESMPAPCDSSSSGEYAARHNPFVHYTDLVVGATCATHDLPYPSTSGLVADLDGVNAPDFVWVTPNLIDDMHDGTVADGNAWLAQMLPAVLGSSWFQAYRSTVVITEDENDAAPSGSCCSGAAAGGQIPALVVSSAARGRGLVDVTGDHYGVLRSIEEVFGLPLLGGADSVANGDLSSLFG
ncbi:MAG: alkaline phosphatase family protein [Candidatus Dormibacteria bacterium]